MFPLGSENAYGCPQNKATGSALTFLTRYSEEGNEFLNKIVTDDATWVCHGTPESKQRSMEWRHSRSPTKKKIQNNIAAHKIMCTVFWDRHGILLVEFLPRDETINAVRYCETLRKLKRTIQNKSEDCSVKALCCFMTMHIPILLVSLKTLFNN
ncbi:hypothetical protein AVEN_39784-1 [Araneus ventricosus]|uniref:Mariner Mos1 transposase n=1 Tax=Araneus ventricosus TaxID=182803 RepID=A0A4Y2MLJ2_ARAVE|nr:hypothetical protein AVEN_39784-1 [Araneus ventricosus]